MLWASLIILSEKIAFCFSVSIVFLSNLHLLHFFWAKRVPSSSQDLRRSIGYFRSYIVLFCRGYVRQCLCELWHLTDKLYILRTTAEWIWRNERIKIDNKTKVLADKSALVPLCRPKDLFRPSPKFHSEKPNTTAWAVAYRGGGVGVGVGWGWGLNPPLNSEGPPKSCQTQPDCENCYKITELRKPTSQDVQKKGSKILKLPRFAIVLH